MKPTAALHAKSCNRHSAALTCRFPPATGDASRAAARAATPAETRQDRSLYCLSLATPFTLPVERRYAEYSFTKAWLSTSFTVLGFGCVLMAATEEQATRAEKGRAGARSASAARTHGAPPPLARKSPENQSGFSASKLRYISEIPRPPRRADTHPAGVSAGELGWPRSASAGPSEDPRWSPGCLQASRAPGCH